MVSCLVLVLPSQRLSQSGLDDRRPWRSGMRLLCPVSTFRESLGATQRRQPTHCKESDVGLRQRTAEPTCANYHLVLLIVFDFFRARQALDIFEVCFLPSCGRNRHIDATVHCLVPGKLRHHNLFRMDGVS